MTDQRHERGIQTLIAVITMIAFGFATYMLVSAYRELVKMGAQ